MDSFTEPRRVIVAVVGHRPQSDCFQTGVIIMVFVHFNAVIRRVRIQFVSLQILFAMGQTLIGVDIVAFIGQYFDAFVNNKPKAAARAHTE